MTPTPFFIPRQDALRDRADDKIAIRRYLFKNAWPSAEDISRQIGLTENRAYRLVAELEAEGRLVHATLGRLLGARRRYLNTRRSILEIRDLTGCPIPWLAAEVGAQLQAKRLPAVEAFNHVMPKLWSLPGVDLGRPDLQITDVVWRRGGAIDAVALYEAGVWAAFVWIGGMLTEHAVRLKASRAIAQLQGQYSPTAWALVGYDGLSAKLAADWWPPELPVLAIAMRDDHIERRPSPGVWTPPPLEQERPARLGWPEEVRQWLAEDENRALTALNRPECYRMLRIMGEAYELDPHQMEAQFGPAYRGPTGALKKAGLLETEKGTGMTKITRLGLGALAAMDRVSAAGVYRRAELYLKEGGQYRIEQLPHNRDLNNVIARLWDEGIRTYAGFRAFRRFADAEGPSRISPDAVVLLDWEGGANLMVYVELERTAYAPADVRDKLRPYSRLQKILGYPVAVLFIARDEAAERNAQEHGKALELELLLTTTLQRFEAGSSWGWDSVWRTVDGHIESLSWLPQEADWMRRVDRDADRLWAGDWDDDGDDLEELEE